MVAAALLTVKAAIDLPLPLYVPESSTITDKLVKVPTLDNVKLPPKFNVVAAAMVLVVVPKLKLSNQLPVVNVNAPAPLPVNESADAFVNEPPVVPNTNVLASAASDMNV